MGARLSQINNNVLELDGSTEYMLTTGTPINMIGDEFTVYGACILVGTGLPANAPRLACIGGAAAANRIELRAPHASGFSLLLRNSANTVASTLSVISTASSDPSPVPGYLNQIAWAIDGSASSARASLNGVTCTSFSALGGSATMSNTSRDLSIGADLDGTNKTTQDVQAFALWSTQLTQAELNYITKYGSRIDLRYNQGDYASAASLEVYVRGGIAAGSGQSGTTWVCDDATNGAGVDVSASAAGLADADIVTGYALPDFLADAVLDFNGTDEYLGTSGNVTSAFGDSWTIAIVFESDVDNADETLLHIKSTATASNFVKIAKLGNTTNDPLSVTMSNSTGTTIKDLQYDSCMGSGSWRALVVTRDGAASGDPIVVYMNGSTETVDTTNTDTAGSMSSTSRQIMVGANTDGSNPFNGRIHSVTIWDRVLTSTQVSEILATAAAFAAFNPLTDTTTNYDGDSGQRDCQRWIRCGVPNTGASGWVGGGAYVSEVGCNTTRIDLTSGAVNMSAADIETVDVP